MKKLRLIFSSILFLALMAQAETPENPPQPRKTAEGIPLFFQADKNNVQVLPQRFDYNLVDEDQITIGDILIDSHSFGFQIAPSRQFPGKYRARFVWPASLLSEGSLLIKDNTGKAIWTTNFRRKILRISPALPNAPPSAELVVDQLNPVLIEDMKSFPFMTFCISRASAGTRVYLCSKEFYLANLNNRLGVKSRPQSTAQGSVEINGKTVSNQGTIFLNNEKESIAFRAKTPSGALLEIETRMKPVDFKDVVLSEDKKQLILTASGTEPVNEDSVRRLSEDEWQAPLDPQRPILYLKGDGNIPMRQEFFIKGEVPMERARPSLESGSFNRIYKPTLELRGTLAPGTSLNAAGSEGLAEKLDGDQFRWRLAGIPAGESSRHSLSIRSGNNTFTASYDVYRDFPLEGGMVGAFWLSSSQTSADFYLQWWMENFLGSPGAWSRLHWGLQLRQSSLLSKKEGEANLSLSRAELLWKAKPGFHFQDPTWGLSFPVEQIQAPGLSLTSFGLGYYFSQKPPRSLRYYLNWYDLKLSYLTGGNANGVKMKSALEGTLLAYRHINPRFSWTYGAGLRQYSFDPGSTKLQIQLQGGANYRF